MLFSIFFAFLPLLAAPGDLDSTFGGTGKIRVGFGSGRNSGHAVAVQPDGKIIAGGSNSNGSVDEFMLVRYLPNGVLDFTFDNDGIVTTKFSNSSSAIYAVAIQPDGKIVAAGDNNRDFALVRYNPDGSLDTGFDGNGIVTTDMGDFGDTINAVAIQSDGRIVAAGFKAQDDTNARDSAVARYNSDGTLDATFSGDGKVIMPISINGNDDANDVVIQPDGKIVTAGQAYTNTMTFALVRYKPDGTLDDSFDGDGIVLTVFENLYGFATAVALQPDGKIVAAGNYGLHQVADFALVRYNPNGSLDTTFGFGGKSVYDVTIEEDNAYALALDNIGRMIIAGSAEDLFTVVRVVGDVAPSNNAVIGGRVATAAGNGIRNAAVVLTGGGLTAPRFAKSSSFGYYTFDNLTLGETYTVRVVSKRYTFSSPTRVISLSGNVGNADFVADAEQNKSGK